MNKRQYYRNLLLAIVVFGMIIPVGTGVVVKIYQDAHGQPSYPWSFFTNIFNLILLVPLSVWWSIPFLALIHATRNIHSHPIWGLKTLKARMIFTWCGLIGGGIGSVITFVNVFLYYDYPLIVFVPLWLYYMVYLVAGLLIGYVIAKGVEAYSKE